jgi:hypothetical protein
MNVSNEWKGIRNVGGVDDKQQGLKLTVADAKYEWGVTSCDE